jgi:hypothetical protein
MQLNLTELIFAISGIVINTVGFGVLIYKISAFITTLKNITDNHEKRICILENNQDNLIKKR